jgi:putative membrane protein
MTHFKSSLPKVSALAIVLGAAACGSTQPSPANSASNAQAAPPAISPYGEPMGQSDNTPSSSMERTPGHEPYLTPSAISNNAPATGTTGGSGDVGTAIETWGGASHQESVGVTNEMGADVSGLNDAQFATVVQAINQSEIQEAQLALTKAATPDVVRLARDMMTAHRDMEKKTASLLARLQMSPSDNAVSNQIRTDSQNEMSTLQGMRGKDFDRDYVDAQVRNHNKALELLDRITPNVKNPDLKDALTHDRSKVEGHLREAERVQETVQKGATNPQPGGHGTVP